MENVKKALVCDWLDVYSGAERCIEQFNKLYDSTQLKAYESELDSVNNKIKEKRYPDTILPDGA